MATDGEKLTKIIKDYGTPAAKAAISRAPSGGGSSKPATYAPGSLETMTAAQAAAAGKTTEYNALVNQYLAPHDITYNGSSPATVTSTGKAYIPNIANLGGTAPVYTPPPQPTVTGTGLLNGLQSATNVPTGWDAVTYANFKKANPNSEPTSEDTSRMLGASTAPDTYDQFLKNMGIPEAPAPERVDRQQIMKEAGVNDIQKRVNDLSAQIGMEQAKTQANLLSARDSAATEGGTEAIFGGRQAQIERESAIRLLPLTALYQAELGNLNTAKEMVNTFVQDEQNYQDRLYQWKSDLRSEALQYADTQQKRQYELQDRADANARDDANNLLDVKGKMFTAALENGQGALAQSIWKSTTIDEVYEKSAGIKTPEKVGDLTYKELNGQLYVLDNQGNVVRTIGDRTMTADEKAAAKVADQVTTQIPALESKVTQIDGLLESSYLIDAVGPNALSRLAPLSTFTAGKQNFIAEVEQLTSKETLDTLLALKAAGGTLGAISEKELGILQGSATTLNNLAVKQILDKDGKVIGQGRNGTGKVVGYEMSEADFKTQLNKIRTSTNNILTAARSQVKSGATTSGNNFTVESPLITTPGQGLTGGGFEYNYIQQ
jgi:hypothetical protein